MMISITTLLQWLPLLPQRYLWELLEKAQLTQSFNLHVCLHLIERVNHV
jgi:hypothetical protein